MASTIKPKQLEAEKWGDQIRRISHRKLSAIASMARELDPLIGKYDTFAKLYDFDECPTAPQDQIRAWVVITASGYDPAGLGISDDVLPAMWAAPSRIRREIDTRVRTGRFRTLLASLFPPAPALGSLAV